MSEKGSLLNTLLGLSMIVEARDPYTGGHLAPRWKRLFKGHCRRSYP